MNEFINLNINSDIIDALNKIEIYSPTPIQEKSIPLLLEGLDVIGQAQTGTGKTFAYSIPLISNIDDNSKKIEALVLCPTRELSIQVAKEIDKLAKNIKKIKCATIYGGESYEKQFKALKAHPQIVIGTPGRIIDQMNRGNIDFSNIKYLVLDEADEMLKMGFQDDLETILKTTPKERQTALFSATLPPFIKNVSKKYMNDPKYVKIEAETLTVKAINQMIYYCKKDQKKDLLVRLLDYYEFKSVIIFTNTKAMVDELALYLQSLGFKADGLHGDLKQQSRDKVMQAFRSSSLEILIATDVAARGIDVNGVECVFNFDLPNENEIYVHRIGRTGRAGMSGMAISLATTRSKNRVAEIEKYINQKIIMGLIPTAKEINTHKQKHLYEKIVSGMEENKDNHEYDKLIMKLSRLNTDPVPLITTLLNMINLNKREYKEIETVTIKNKDNSKKTPKNKKEVSNEKSYIEINLGSADNIKAKELVCYFHDNLKIHREHFGKIIIKKKYSFIEIKKDALRFLRDIKKYKYNGKTISYREIEKEEMPKE